MVIGEVPVGTDVLVIGGGDGGRTVAEAVRRSGRQVLIADPAPVPPGMEPARWLTGTARFSTPRRVAVSDGARVVHVEATDVVLATGSRPAVPDGVRPDDRRLIGPEDLPTRLRAGTAVAVIGAGASGVSAAARAAALGARVTLVEQRDRCLPALAPAVGAAVAGRLAATGVAVVTGAGTTHPAVVDADVVVAAAGRRPATDDLGLDEAAAPRRADRSFAVDAAGRIQRHLFAVGAAAGVPAGFAAAEAARVVAALDGTETWFEPGAVPTLVELPDGWSAVSVGVLRGARRGRAGGSGSPAVELVADEAGTVVGVSAWGVGAVVLLGAAVVALEAALTVDELVLCAAPGPLAVLAAAALAAAPGAGAARGYPAA
jgi:pyruvate/2-oxoglutarate dehydrogenase complex dihydrolipoamide dehydrogenase (E3) component